MIAFATTAVDDADATVENRINGGGNPLTSKELQKLLEPHLSRIRSLLERILSIRAPDRPLYGGDAMGQVCAPRRCIQSLPRLSLQRPLVRVAHRALPCETVITTSSFVSIHKSGNNARGLYADVAQPMLADVVLLQLMNDGLRAILRN